MELFSSLASIRTSFELASRMVVGDKRVLIGLEKLECNKKVAHAICYVFLRMIVKRQAEASAQFMKKVADILVRGGVGGCSSEDFVTRDTSVPQPQHFDPVTNPSLALGPPLTACQLLHLARNPEAPESNSGNKSPSLASTDEETDNEEVASEPQAYFTTFPDDTGNEASAFFPDA
ncbi:hypothetical protein DY000_02029358 [Brassica cretica]|uniref:CCR4-NOT transcription complex subunit 11 n=1 Tax=Brassica cretica TaxID=69181 RepID=A0ABQ7DM53_BRACR|nr:hypothetical protein DY000_02029358 [Brassica cretica]